jgi:hypothetical protein
MYQEKNLLSDNLLASSMQNGMISPRTRTSVETDRLRYSMATALKLCVVGNRQCLYFRSFI